MNEEYQAPAIEKNREGAAPLGQPPMEAAAPEPAAFEPAPAETETITARELKIPADENDAEGWAKLYGALGRPDTPDGYGLAEHLKGEEIDPQFAGAMGQAMHGAGLSTGQARKVAEAYQEQWKAAAAEAEQWYAAEKDEVLKTFAPGRIEAARRAFRLSGVSADLAETIERSIGPKAAVELFAKLGAALAEDRPAEKAEGAGFTGTAEAVRHRIDQLMEDQNFRARYQRGEESAVREMERLSRLAVGR